MDDVAKQAIMEALRFYGLGQYANAAFDSIDQNLKQANLFVVSGDTVIRTLTAVMKVSKHAR